MTNKELWITIGILALGTLITRGLPFILFPDNKDLPPYIKYLSNILPFTVMGLLVVYCLKDVPILSYPHGVPELISIIIIALLHLWKKNSLISIAGGTIVYMFLVQVVFI